MSQAAQEQKRFRVALSFPGEHRAPVEKIAEALREKLGHERVLYDRWYAAEFNRLNLDTYLSKLYHDDSDLIAVFLCKEYNAKQWCGLEWRACRDLAKHKEDARLMFFRLDDADIPGLYSIDGYQDIRAMSDGEVAAAILSRLGAEKPTGQAHRIFVGKLPTVNPILIGREPQIALLDRAWADPATNVVQVIAAGGRERRRWLISGFASILARPPSSDGRSTARAVRSTGRLRPIRSSRISSGGSGSRLRRRPRFTSRPKPWRGGSAKSACCSCWMVSSRCRIRPALCATCR
jgi:hypothetical protein